MLKKIKRIIIISILLYLLLITWQVFAGINDNLGVLPKNGKVSDASVQLFFSLQPNGWDENVIVEIVMMALLPALGAGLYIYLKNNGMFADVQQRIDYSAFLKKGLTNTFLVATLISVFTNIYRLGLINWFYYPLVFQTQPAQIYRDARPGYFSSNELIDVIFYIIFAAIGWGIFAVLIFSVGLFVKKNALFYIMGPIIAIALILFALLGNLQNPVWYTIANISFPFTILAPGQFALGSRIPILNSYLIFFVTVILYLLVTITLVTTWYKRKRKLG